ncbi:MAG: OB-fold domain-containing protein, partial [Rhodospirillales bacterium]|nr:OB-fold domain-containing protein [Rhodospirillales bacterium]
IFYPRALCPECGSPNLSATEASGQGSVYSTSVVRQSPKAGEDYNISVIELAEGPRLMSRVVEMDAGEVSIGMAVQAFVGEIGETPEILFRKSSGGAA